VPPYLRGTNSHTVKATLCFILIHSGGKRRVRVPTDARAFWIREPGRGEIRTVQLPDPGPAEVLVRTLRSGVSRGTEALVFRGGVPQSQYDVMRAPFQEGEFPGPVKYGYLNVGVVDRGPDELRGRTVFCLFPHQTAYVVPVDAVTVVPDEVPPERAVPARWRPRSTPCGTPVRLSATGSRSWAPGWLGAASPGWSVACRERR